jgi:hypothetical protein
MVSAQAQHGPQLFRRSPHLGGLGRWHLLHILMAIRLALHPHRVETGQCTSQELREAVTYSETFSYNMEQQQ